MRKLPPMAGGEGGPVYDWREIAMAVLLIMVGAVVMMWGVTAMLSSQST